MKVFVNILVQEDDSDKGIHNVEDEVISALEEAGIKVIWHKVSEGRD